MKYVSMSNQFFLLNFPHDSYKFPYGDAGLMPCYPLTPQNNFLQQTNILQLLKFLIFMWLAKI